MRLPQDLPEAAEGFVAYAVEVFSGGERAVLPVGPEDEVAQSLRASAEEARERLAEVLGDYSTPIPEGLREVSRLGRDGIRASRGYSPGGSSSPFSRL